MAAAPLDIHIVSQTRLFPESRLDGSSPHHIPLSILDATVARFSPTAAVWMYDRSEEKQGQAALSTDQLTIALQKTLNAYPQWAGQLQWAPYKPDGDHTQRFGRMCLSYGATSDPGVEVVVAQCLRALASLIPSPTDRVAGSGCWDAVQVPSVELFPTTSLATRNSDDPADLPGMLVQLTTFDCGGVTIAIKMAHPLADAQTMTCFVHDWAAINRALVADAPLPPLSPVFDPSLVDRAASGDIDAARPDPALVCAARALPLHHYDWWASADGCPPGMTQATQIPPVLDLGAIGPLGTPLPWSEWDVTAPVAHYLVYFTADEVRGMWKEASSSTSARVSHLDALLSHVWALIIRARGLEHDEKDVHLDVTFGIRGRLSPALPENFLGSPITLAQVTATGAQVASANSLGAMAATIRSSVAQFTSSTIPALLHDMAYEASPQRLWNTFLGRRNTIVTSWIRLGLYDMDFGGGMPPRYVDAVMPSADGCVQVMETGPTDYGKKAAGHWYDNGATVSLHLNTEVMQKLLQDPLLRKYSNILA